MLVSVGDFVKAKELIDKLSSQKQLPSHAYLAISKFYEFNEDSTKVFETIQKGIERLS